MSLNFLNLNLVETRVSVDGKPCDFVGLELFQTMSGHHRFTIEVNYRASCESVWTETPEAIFKQLGSPVTTAFAQGGAASACKFLGVVTRIEAGAEATRAA
ncbi:MAG: hypothetical protein LBH06_10325 [Rikenellaceae bacterium]|jgi:hypothetical protein|nr:hypothetical protein [Rikenellaceae bacterium]